MRRVAVSPFGVPGVVGNEAGITALPIWLIVGLMLGSPQESTKTTSNRYGIQAMNIWPKVNFVFVTDTGLSPSRRMMFFGFHRYSTITMTMMQASELRMS